MRRVLGWANGSNGSGWSKRIAAVTLLGALAIGAGGSPIPAHADERRIVTVEDADFFGADFETVKDVDLEACKAACIDNNLCRAFTYNVRARWCFLKSDIGDLQTFKGAIAGRIVEVRDTPVVKLDARERELSFIPEPFRKEAERFARRLPRLYDAGADTLARLRGDGLAALDANNGPLAERNFGKALTLEPGDFELWAGLALSFLSQRPDDWRRRYAVEENGSAAAINTYLRAATDAERARALDLIGAALERRQAWKPVIKAWRLALSLDERPGLRARYDKMVAEHGFRILDHQVDSDAVEPRICVVFSDTLPRATDMEPYVRVTGDGPFAITAEGAQVCVDGVRHGERYAVLLREGLPAADGEKLEKSADINVYIRDRTPSVNFVGRAYVLPAGKDATIPIVSVNTDEVEVEIYRIGDRGLVSALRNDRFLSQLSSYSADQLRTETGEEVWKGVVETERRLNQDVTTAIPLEEIGLEMKPGIYAMTARAKTDVQNQWGPWATQWFLVSDLGLSAYSASDGVTASVRSLTTADAVSGVNLRLVAVNNEILGETVTGEDGFARFAPGLARGVGGRAPALLVAETEAGDYAFLDLTKPAFDLSDRGVEGRPAPGPIDVFAWTERGVYRPGETVHATALARDDKANALPALPLTFVFERPDGVEHARATVADAGLGGRAYSLPLPPTIQQGTWMVRIFADPKGQSLAEKTFLVEDFQPERVDFELETAASAIDPLALPEISVDAKFLYGAPASDQRLEGETVVAPVRESKAYPGYRFGLEDEEGYPNRTSLPDGLVTDADGKLSFVPDLPEMPQTTGLMTSTVVARLVEAGGRFVERTLDLPVLADGLRIGIKPAFEDGVDEGGPAEFDVIAIDREGRRVAESGLKWSLVKVERRYQWYRADGRWSYEPVVTTRRIANGTLDVSEGEAGHISAPVTWGEFRLEVVREGAEPAASSVTFTAGWYVSSATSETPDVLEVGLDKAAYRVGETAVLRLKPRFDGTAVITVLSDRLIETKVVPVSGDSAEVRLDVTDDWGAGAYVTAALYRPMDLEAKRMPARAIGLEWLEVDPGDRALEVVVEAPETILPRTTLDVPLRLANLEAGQEAFVTVAAVDVGILNLTRYQTPDPERWYFGQRSLGTEIRDLYGQLIDRTLGDRGKVRSGGDGMGGRLAAPPPQEEPLAMFSGVVAVDDQGQATVSFDIPDFNGTVRLMAVAWSAAGVGHAEKDVIVRDPVVMTATLPRFLAPGDQSRLIVELDNVDGPAGDYRIETEIDGPVSIAFGGSGRTLALEPGKRQRLLLPLAAGDSEGDAQFTLTVTGPGGISAQKRLALGVRDNQPDVTRRSFVTLTKGGTLTLDEGLITGLKPAGTRVAVAAGGAARINIPGLLGALDRYPYGCTEQTVSRALPLVYLNDVAIAAGLDGDKEVRERVDRAIVRVLANQSSSGSFGLWSSYGESDTWLDAYVTDFLIRAKERGYTVPQVAFDSALDSLANRVAYASDFSDGGEGVAYALYVLTRAGRASLGDLRYYADVKLDHFATPLAKAQIGAALALYGERDRASRVFKAAVDALPGDRKRWRDDYGTPLRDGAGILSYAVETRVDPGDVDRLTQFVADRQEESRFLSTQDMAWLLLAAYELQKDAAASRFAVDGAVQTGPLIRRFDGASLQATPVTIENLDDRQSDVVVSVTGRPNVPEPAGGEGFTIRRAFFDLDGNPVDTAAVAQNTRLVVVLTVETTDLGVDGRLLVVDRLPAGLVIDNPRLVRAGDIGAFDWLDDVDQVDHQEFRDDRFVVALDQRRFSGDTYTFAYTARAGTPGLYAHPPATVEDMYNPDRSARTDTGRFEVLGPRQ